MLRKRRPRIRVSCVLQNRCGPKSFVVKRVRNKRGVRNEHAWRLSYASNRTNQTLQRMQLLLTSPDHTIRRHSWRRKLKNSLDASPFLQGRSGAYVPRRRGLPRLLDGGNCCLGGSLALSAEKVGVEAVIICSVVRSGFDWLFFAGI